MSGGIWLLWDDLSVTITVLKKHKQYLHCEVEGIRAIRWLFTAVYASPREEERREMWKDIHEIASRIHQPWLLAGDFNDIKNVEEQRGGRG